MADSRSSTSQLVLRPFLILASPRSGSSLLRALLNEHSNIVVPPECGYIQWLGLKYGGAPVNPKRFVSDLKECKKIEGWDLVFSDLEEQLVRKHGDKNVGFDELVEFTHCYYSKEKFISCWGDKNNYYINSPDEVLTYCNFRVIHLVRDPRGCFLSNNELRNDYTSIYAPQLSKSSNDFCDRWLKENRAVEELRSSTDYIRIKYEDVIEEPQMVLNSLFGWIGVSTESTHDTFYNRVDEPDITMEWKQKLREPLDARRSNAWREDLDENDARSIWQKTKKELLSYGYPE